MLPVFTNDQIANYITSGYATNQNYTPTHWNVSTGGTISVNIASLQSDGQFFATEALKTWSEATGINFTFTTGVAQISFSDAGSLVAQTSWVSTGSFLTSATVQISQNWTTTYLKTPHVTGAADLNTYAYQTYLHEIGHALGLGHAGNYNGSATYDPNLGTVGHNQYLNDSWQTSVMSYFTQTENTYLNPVGGTSTAGFAFVMTPMAADILAVQSLYGVSTTAHTGNTVYGFHATAGNVIFDATQITGASYTIEDSNGIDTMDYSGYTMAQKISLVAETFSDIGGVKGSVTIARGTVIENAIGGSGSDIIIGNAADNILKGGAGNDTLDGGAGSDTADYSDKSTSIVVTLSGATLATVFVNSIAEDSIKNIESIIGGSGNDTLTGDGLSNTLNGGLGDDTLIGGIGADTLIGGGGNDTVSYAGSAIGVTVDLNLTTAQVSAGDASGDVLVDIKSLTGSAFNDILTGSTSNAFVNGGSGSDIIIGSAFYSILTGGSGNDTFIFTVDTINYAATHNLTANSNNIQDYSRDATGAGDQIALVGIAASTINYTSMGPTFGYLNYTNGAINGSGNASITLNYSSSQLTSPLLVYGYTTLANAESHNLASGYIYTLDSYTPSQTWLHKLDSYGTTALLASTDLFNRNGTTTKTIFDEMSTQSWSRIVDNYDTAGHRTDQFTLSDDGTTHYAIYDANSIASWSFIVENYDVAQHRTDQFTFSDDGTTHFAIYDANSIASWSYIVENYDAAKHRTDQFTLSDDGTTHYAIYDANNNASWSYIVENYDTAQHRTDQFTLSDDGTTHYAIYDANNTANWSLIVNNYDAIHHLTDQLITYDSGFYDSTIFDVNNLQPWAEWHRSYDASGQLVSQFFI